MRILNQKINLKSTAIFDMQDITHHLSTWITNGHLTNGLINVFLEHTSAAICVNEFTDPKLLNDFKRKLAEFNPAEDAYEHNESHACNGDSCVNGHSHCNAIFLPTSITLQIVDGKVNLGTWQRIFFIELDRARPRNISLMYLGE